LDFSQIKISKMAKMMKKVSMKKKSAMKSATKKTSTKKMSMKKGGKKVMNEYFRLALDAKKHNKPSFVYNGNTYKKKTKGHLVFYSK